MDEAIQKLTELNALLLAITGSVGTDELEAHQVDAFLNVCLSLSHEALQGFKRIGLLHSPNTLPSSLFHFYFINEVIRELTIQSHETIVRTVSGLFSKVFSPSTS